MLNPILIPERIRTSIELGESHFREFKSGIEGPPDQKVVREKKSVSDDICRTLVGFANADGGELLVGVEDDGQITGLERYSEKILDYLERCWKDGVHKDTPLENVRVSRTSLDNHTILHFIVPKMVSRICLTSDGRCLQRKDLETSPVNFEDIQFSRQEQVSRIYDREYVSGSSIADLDIDAVKVLADHVSAGMTAEKCLLYLGLADFSPTGLQLTRAALLLFAKDIWKWHPRSHVRIMRVSGTELKTGTSYNVASDTPIQGNVLYLIQETWNLLRPYLTQTKLGNTGRFEASVVYPEAACREALINAIAHRDYSQEGIGIEIFVFDNRIEVKNPGSLLSSLLLSEIVKLDGAHQSRNTLIARCLREIGYMREVGEGIRRMFELMNANELEAPKLQSESSRFSVTLSNALMYSREHILWLDNFSSLPLSKEEKAVVVLGYDSKVISANDVIKGLSLVDIEEYRKIIDSLQKRGILQSTMDKAAAYRYARTKKVERRDVPRYKIIPPSAFAEQIKTDAKPSQKKDNSRRNTSKEIEFRVFIGNISHSIKHDVIESEIDSHAPGAVVEWPTLLSLSAPKYCIATVRGELAAKALAKAMSSFEIDGLKLIARTAPGVPKV